MTGEEERTLLAEALDRLLRDLSEGQYGPGSATETFTAALLTPRGVVDRIAAARSQQRAAEELELAAVLTVPSEDTSEDVREALFRRAAALRAGSGTP